MEERQVVLIVDDETAVREVVAKMLAREGIDALTAADGREAVEVFRRHADLVRVVLLDMIMPVMSGEEVFREIRNIRPGTKVLLTSGYDERDALAHFREGEPAGFIQKPFRMAELVAAIRSTLEA